MNQEWTDKWNQNYQNEEYVYGKEPNEFFRQELEKLNPGKILLPAEGEGRNAVFAAKKGWDVSAFDISSEGKNKAENLAQSENVTVNYQIGEFLEMDYAEESFDAVALIYAHFPPAIREKYHAKINSLLCPGATVILEGFSKNHLKYRTENPKIGGPGDFDSLFSKEEIQNAFQNFEIIMLEETEIELSEGLFHNGTGSAIRFVGRKKII